MEYEIIILTLGVIASIGYLIKTRNTFSAIIIAIQVLSLGLALFDNPTFGYYMFGFAIILSMLYPVVYKEANTLNRQLIWIFLFPILIVFVFGVLHLPGYSYGRLAMLIPLTVFIYALMNKNKFKYEIGFMILFVADALIKFIGLFN